MAGRGLQVSQMMVTDFRTIPVHATLSQAADLLLAGEQREFPVVDNLGRTEGILTRDNLIRGLSRQGPDADRGRGHDRVDAHGARRRWDSRMRSTGCGPVDFPRSPSWTSRARWWACSLGTTSPTCCWCAARGGDTAGIANS